MEKGEVTGGALITNGFTQAFVYSGGIMIDLGTLNGGTFSVGVGINRGGQVAGNAETSDGNGISHAVFCNGLTMVD